MRYFDKSLIANHAKEHGRWWAGLNAQWDHFHAAEEALAQAEAPHIQAPFMTNAAAILPRDAWLEFDSRARRVMRQDDGRPYMQDLMPLAKPMNIGKVAQVSLVSSDISDDVTVSLSGQPAIPVDKVTYDTRGAPVPIFQKGFYRNWREWNSLSSENFDALADDQEAALAKVRKKNAEYVLDGDVTINAGGYVGYGIRTSPYSKAINLGSAAGGADIDLTDPSVSSDDVVNFFNNYVGKILDDELVYRGVNIYVSNEIMRNLDRPYSGALGFKSGTLRDAILAGRRVAKIEDTFELTGNEFFGFVPDAQYIRPLIGMATSTFAMPRAYPMANYQFMVWNAMGLEIRADFNGRTGVFYSTDID